MTHLYGGPHDNEHLQLQVTSREVHHQHPVSWTCKCHDAVYRGLAGEGALWFQRSTDENVPLAFVKAFAQKEALDG